MMALSSRSNSMTSPLAWISWDWNSVSPSTTARATSRERRNRRSRAETCSSPDSSTRKRTIRSPRRLKPPFPGSPWRTDAGPRAWMRSRVRSRSFRASSWTGSSPAGASSLLLSVAAMFRAMRRGAWRRADTGPVRRASPLVTTMVGAWTHSSRAWVPSARVTAMRAGAPSRTALSWTRSRRSSVAVTPALLPCLATTSPRAMTSDAPPPSPCSQAVTLSAATSVDTVSDDDPEP